MASSDAALSDDLVCEFVAECVEMLDQVEPEMLSASCLDGPLADKVFRPLHSLKGVAGSFGLDTITYVAHTAETFLSLFRNGSVTSNSTHHIEAFLKTFDLLRQILSSVEENKNDKGFEDEAYEIIKMFELLTKELISGEVNPDIKGFDDKVIPIEKEKIVQVEQNTFEESEEFKVEITQEMMDGFKSESLEAFEVVERNLLKLIEKPDPELLHSTFRYIHSFKGNCGIFSLSDMEKLGHKMETVLGMILHEEIKGDNLIYDLIVKIVDALKESISSLEVEKENKVVGVDLYLELLDNACLEKRPEKKEKIVSPPVQMNLESSNGLKFETGVAVNSTTAPPVVEKIKEEKEQKSQQIKSVAQTDIRVSTAKLDKLNNLMGELVTAKTMVLENIKHIVNSDENEILEKAIHFFSKTVNDLQDVAVDIRMVPVSGLFNKMIRVVHDISKKAQKKVNLLFEGEETEIDKTLLEKISDPLVHMIRNSVDHGIESSEQRIAQGKNPVGTVILSAKQEAGEVWIIISDDGKGLDREKIIKKAIENKLIQDDGSSLSDQEVFKMIYLPGFSTAEKVTDISGRGVGMDVVMQNVKALNGRIDITSTKGIGSKFYIKIPLTLAIMDGMLMQVGHVKYILPVSSIQEIVKVKKEEVTSIMASQKLIDIRGKLIPITSLAYLHGMNETENESDDAVVVVMSSGGHVMALLVDEILGQNQTVVKPLSKIFQGLKGVSSCSILGDGEVSLILDVNGLIDLSLHNKINQNSDLIQVDSV